MLQIKNIAIAGTGNLSWHLAKNLKKIGISISGVWSRNPDHTKEFGEYFSIKPCFEITDLKANTDLIIMAISDSAIEDVARQLGNFPVLLL